MIAFKGTYTPAQWRRGLQLASANSRAFKLLQAIALALVLVLFGILIYTYLSTGQINASRWLRFLLSAGVILVWIVKPIWRTHQMANEPWKRSGHAPSLEGSVTTEGVLLLLAGNNSRLERWLDYVKAVTREDIVVLIGQNARATIMPRDFFAKEDSWHSFRQMVSFNVVVPR